MVGMSHTWGQINRSAAAAIIAAVVMLTIFAVQYPLSTTFPMGGDAPYYLTTVKNIVSSPFSATSFSSLSHSWYPLAFFLLLPFTLLPITWPIAFVWWAAVGQIAAGLALGWMLYRLFNWQTAAAGLAIWAITPISATLHFEDGTIAQLWSYAFLFLFFERFHSRKPFQTFLLLLLTSLTHPITGLVLFVGLALSLPFLRLFQITVRPQNRHFFALFMIAVALALIAGATLLVYRNNIFLSINANPRDIGIFEYIQDQFLPIILIAPLGIPILLKKLQSHPQTRNLIVVSLIAFSILGLNHIFGVHVWERRFAPYFVITIVVLSSVAWPFILKNIFTWRGNRFIFSLLFFSTIAVIVWPKNAFVYNYYESTSQYARISPDEISAIEWMQTNLPPASTIRATNATRHSEWIPVLSEHEYRQVNENDPIGQLDSPFYSGNYYMAFFTNEESVPNEIKDNPSAFPVVFQNQAVTLITINQP
jgi:hypothetical protein